MTTTQPGNKNNWLLIPLFGILIYVLLYFIATFFYPGGSQVDKNSIGFSWTQNYWCNVLNETAINGQPNPARPFGLTAMVFLSFSLAAFWYIFPRQMIMSKTSRIVIQLCGIISMSVGLFIFTSFHDSVINVASLFGVIAMIGTFIGLYKVKWQKLFWFGVFNLILIALNNILYHGNGLRFYLPVVQRLSFLSFLLWICLIDIQLWKNTLSKRANQR